MFLEQVADMEAETEATRAKIMTLEWDRKRKANALACLSEEDVKRLRGLDDDMFEATLEDVVSRGMQYVECLRDLRLVGVSFL